VTACYWIWLLVTWRSRIICLCGILNCKPVGVAILWSPVVAGLFFYFIFIFIFHTLYSSLPRRDVAVTISAPPYVTITQVIRNTISSKIQELDPSKELAVPQNSILWIIYL
jgi:hypothetical protein